MVRQGIAEQTSMVLRFSFPSASIRRDPPKVTGTGKQGEAFKRIQKRARKKARQTKRRKEVQYPRGYCPDEKEKNIQCLTYMCY